MLVRFPPASTGTLAGREGPIVNTDHLRYAMVQPRAATSTTGKTWHVVVAFEPLTLPPSPNTRIVSLVPGVEYVSKVYDTEQEARDALDEFYARMNIPMIAESAFP